MKSVVVLSVIVAFMIITYFLNKWLQHIIQPRRSFRRLMFYFLSVLISVFVLSFLMVIVIARLYPDELIK